MTNPYSTWQWRTAHPAVRGVRIAIICGNDQASAETLAEAFAQEVSAKETYKQRAEELAEWKKRSQASRKGRARRVPEETP